MEDSGERVSVQTYVSADQRRRWREEADDLDMSQAEYVRSMVQAGRRSFSLYNSTEELHTGLDTAAEADSPDATPGGDALEVRILDVLREREHADWDELVAGVTDDIEERLEEALDGLQSEDRIRYSGREGGYAVVDDGR